MKCFLYSLILSLLSFACNTDNNSNSSAPKKSSGNYSIALLPFSDADTIFVKRLKDSLQKRLAVNFTTLPQKQLPAFAFYKPRQRYIADSLLIFLKSSNQQKADKIVGITTKDISTQKGEIANWGVLGLGYCPGEACVISTFRAGKGKVGDSKFLNRMTILALHELGHTFGLPHCPETSCIMKDAEGKMNLDNGNSYCPKCHKYLSGKGILK